LSVNNGTDAVFEWLNNCESFNCDSIWFCDKKCNQPAQFNPIVFLRMKGGEICLDNGPDNQHTNSIICQFVSKLNKLDQMKF
jgi:hypothetical protein